MTGFRADCEGSGSMSEVLKHGLEQKESLKRNKKRDGSVLVTPEPPLTTKGGVISHGSCTDVTARFVPATSPLGSNFIRRSRELGVLLSATVGVIGHRWLAFGQRFVQHKRHHRDGITRLVLGPRKIH